MRKTDREHLKREKLLFQYSLALEEGDFDKVATVLAAAENDPILERMILDMNEELQREPIPMHANNNHKGQPIMTVITNSTPQAIPYKRQSRLTGVLALVAAMLMVLFAAYLLLNNDDKGQVSSSAIQINGTLTPSLSHNGLTATALWDEQADTDTGVWIEALNPDINVRSQPDIMSDQLGQIQPGEYYAVLGRRFEWLQIQFPGSSREVGWVFDDLVRIIGDEDRIPDVVAEDLSTVTPPSTTDGLDNNQQTATAYWVNATQTIQVQQGTYTPGPTTTQRPTTQPNANQQTATAYWDQGGATAFWDQQTATASSPTPLSTTEGFNSNEQTATAFWIQATQTVESIDPAQQTASAIETQNSQIIATYNAETATAFATEQLPTVPPPTPSPVSGLTDAPFEGALQYPDFDRLFRGVNGTFVLYDPQNDVTLAYNPERAQQRFAPHSTFKILNAAISLETGAMPDEDFIIEWDQEQYPLTEYPETSPFNEWRQDQNLRTGMQYSVVWFYTEVARRIGEEQMADWVERVGYGNMDTSAWLEPVPFWLGGSLEITSLEQTQFLWRFYNGELGFSERTTDIVRDLIVLEETETYRLSGKTGTGPDGTGWLVGYLERGDDVYVYALNITPVESANRLELTKQIFIEMGLIN